LEHEPKIIGEKRRIWQGKDIHDLRYTIYDFTNLVPGFRGLYPQIARIYAEVRAGGTRYAVPTSSTREPKSETCSRSHPPRPNLDYV
jgi:hypothetical protein